MPQPYYLSHGGEKFDEEKWQAEDFENVQGDRDEELGFIIDIPGDDGLQLLQVCYCSADYILDIMREIEGKEVLSYKAL